MSINIESIIEALPALASFGILMLVIYIVISNDDDNLSTP